MPIPGAGQALASVGFLTKIDRGNLGVKSAPRRSGCPSLSMDRHWHPQPMPTAGLPNPVDGQTWASQRAPRHWFRHRRTGGEQSWEARSHALSSTAASRARLSFPPPPIRHRLLFQHRPLHAGCQVRRPLLQYRLLLLPPLGPKAHEEDEDGLAFPRAEKGSSQSPGLGTYAPKGDPPQKRATLCCG